MLIFPEIVKQYWNDFMICPAYWCYDDNGITITANKSINGTAYLQWGEAE